MLHLMYSLHIHVNQGAVSLGSYIEALAGHWKWDIQPGLLVSLRPPLSPSGTCAVAVVVFVFILIVTVYHHSSASWYHTVAGS